MNKRVAMFIAVYLVKIILLGALVVPAIVYGVSQLIILATGVTPTDAAEALTGIGLCVFIGIQLFEWLFGHKEEVDKYYDEKDCG